MEDTGDPAKNLQDDINNEHGPQSRLNQTPNTETPAQRIERMRLKAKKKSEERKKQAEEQKKSKLTKQQKRAQAKKNKKHRS